MPSGVARLHPWQNGVHVGHRGLDSDLLDKYTVYRDAMARWLFWGSCLNPIFYAFAALMVNEFKRVTFTCDFC